MTGPTAKQKWLYARLRLSSLRRHCESATFYQLCHKSYLRFADKQLDHYDKVGKTLRSHNSDRGFESWPFLGYEVEPPAC